MTTFCTTINYLLPIGLTAFGWFMAVHIQRPAIFKFKLGVVWSIPLFLPLIHEAYADNEELAFSYHNLFIYAFIILCAILYWREIRTVSTKHQYYKGLVGSFLDQFPDLVWMKDENNRFTYVNKAICDRLLLCDYKKALGYTSREIANRVRSQGIKYTFGEVCCDSDEVVKELGESKRFFEDGFVDGEYIALQVFKAPLYKDGELVGTIGVGRDVTYDVMDHKIIGEHLDSGDCKRAAEMFLIHARRFHHALTGSSPSRD